MGRWTIEAESEAAAIELALGPECPFPKGVYVEDSVQVDDTVTCTSKVDFRNWLLTIFISLLDLNINLRSR